MSAGNWWAPRGRGSGMPCLSLLITMTIAYRHPPAQQQQTPWAQRPTSPPLRLSTFPPCPLFQTPHDVALDVAIESLSPSLLVRPSVCLCCTLSDSFTRPNHVSECGAQTPAWDDDDAASNADTNTPTRQGQYEASSNLELHPRTRQHQSASPPRRFCVPSCLVSLYFCPTLPCMSLCAISRALSRFHHVIHPTLTPTSTPPISLTHLPIAKTGACSCSHVSPSLQRRLVKKYSSPTYPPSLLPFASPLCSFVKSPPFSPQPSESRPSPALLLHIITQHHPLLHPWRKKTLLATALDADHGASRPLPLPFLCSSTSANRLSFFLSLTHSHTHTHTHTYTVDVDCDRRRLAKTHPLAYHPLRLLGPYHGTLDGPLRPSRCPA
jgi:hypothetical protein